MKRTLALVVAATTVIAVILAASVSSASKPDIAGRSVSELAAGTSLVEARQRPTEGPPILNPSPKPESGYTTFKVTCVDVMGVQGSDGLTFYCRPNTGNGDTFPITVASWADGTGRYPVGHEEGVTSGIIDARRNASIAPIVTAFIEFNEGHPWAVLEVSGFHSKLPAANGRRVADLVQYQTTEPS